MMMDHNINVVMNMKYRSHAINAHQRNIYMKPVI
jgi:hypothetical protein